MLKMPVYIIHPFRGAGNDYEENLARIMIICKIILEKFTYVVPVSPVLNFAFLDDKKKTEREMAVDCCLELLQIVNKCGGEAWVFGNYSASEGCKREIEMAQRIGMEIRYNLPHKILSDRVKEAL